MRKFHLALLAVVCLAAACGPNGNPPPSCRAPSSLCAQPSGPSICVDLAADKNNCGACGDVCPVPGNGGATSCSAGKCVAACSGGPTFLVCNASQGADGGAPLLSCTDTAVDPLNCGACGNVCPSNQQCKAGVCAAPATPGMTACGGPTGGIVYKNLLIDHDNCGTCGNACLGNESCREGRCDPCPVSQCNGACVDTLTDSANCGACGAAVPASGFCENGLPRSGKISVDLGAPGNLGVLPAATAVSQDITVHSQVPLQNVSMTWNGTSCPVSQPKPYTTSPTVFRCSYTTPAAPNSITYRIVATDEQYDALRPDASQHIADVTLPAIPLITPNTTAPTLQATVGTTALAGQWVPLNAPKVTLTASLGGAAATGLSAVEFHNGSIIIGRAPIGAPALQVAPAELGLGAVSVTACTVDVFGVTSANCSAAIAFTVGKIPLFTPATGQPTPAQPVIARGVNNATSIYYVNSGGSVIAAPFDQLSSTPAQPGAVLGGDTFIVDTITPTPEGTGVYAIKTGGAAIERFDCASTSAPCANATYATPPASAAFRQFVVTTKRALAVSDAANVVYFAKGGQTPGANVAVAAGIPQTEVLTLPNGGLAVMALNGTNLDVDLYDPVLGLVNLDRAANGTAIRLEVLPQGDLIWQYTVANQLYIGAALFDGTAVRATMTGAPFGPVSSSVFRSGFTELKPGVILGGAPDSSAANRINPLEIDLTVTPHKTYTPTQYNAATGAGPLCTYCVQDRYGSRVHFGFSDDGTKAIFMTADTTVAPAPFVTVYHLWLLDLATGVATSVAASDLLRSSSVQPHFVGNSGAPGAPSTPAIVWTESLNGQGNTPHARLSFATWSGNTVSASTVDREAIDSSNGGSCGGATRAICAARFGSTGSSFYDSAAAGSYIFASDNGAEGIDLYQVALTPSGPIASAKRIMERMFWLSLREDTGRLLVERADGALYAAKLTQGGDLSLQLQPVLSAAGSGEAPYKDPFNSNTNSFGFTIDGNHAYATVDDYWDPTLSNFGALLETVDLATGARRNLGRVAYTTNLAPPAILLGGGSTALMIDPANFDAFFGNAVFREVVAPPGSGTPHRETGLSAATYLSTLFAQVSVDGTEAFIDDGSNAWVDFFADGSTSGLPPNSGIAFPLQRWFVPFATQQVLPQWSQVNSSGLSGGGESQFKEWGGPTQLPPVTLSLGTYVSPVSFVGQVSNPLETADFRALFYSFRANSDSSPHGYVIALPLSGRPPPPAPRNAGN